LEAKLAQPSKCFQDGLFGGLFGFRFIWHLCSHKTEQHREVRPEEIAKEFFPAFEDLADRPRLFLS